MILFLLATLLGSFLLFQVQPLMGRFILPWFGGTPAVWSTCMLFFQALLLAGYAYSHALVSRLPLRRQAVVHGGLVVLVALLVASLTLASGSALEPREWLEPEDSAWPIPRILLLLTVTVAAPYFVLSATSPLVQAWFSRVFPSLSPYRLYVLSNVGSLVGLLAYPFLVEPGLTLASQALAWSVGFVLFGALMIGCARKAGKGVEPGADTGAALASPAASPTRVDKSLWLALAACASTMLLAVTNRLCQDVAVTPLLWVLPLSVYLLTFIVTFSGTRGYSRPIWGIALTLASAAVVLAQFFRLGMVLDLAVFTAILLTVCMVCHGELVRLKPHPRHLTSFYLLVSAGGALGGGFVTLLAPILYDWYWEYQAALVGTWLLLLLVLFREAAAATPSRTLRPAAWGVAMATFALAGLLAYEQIDRDEGLVVSARSFYGVSTVFQIDVPGSRDGARVLFHGTTRHGVQFQHPALKMRTTAYYGTDAGVGRALRSVRGRPDRSGSIRVGIIGLGAGTLAAQGRSGDSFRFYEIDEEVIALSSGPEPCFTFLRDSQAQTEVVLGDGRVSLQKELARTGSDRFDVLAVDAFSGDAVPVHLLTVEAVRLYVAHLAADGILALHVTNKYLDLTCVLAQAASALGLAGAVVRSPADNRGHDPCTWILLAQSPAALSDPLISGVAGPLVPDIPGCYWTDDHYDLFAALR